MQQIVPHRLELTWEETRIEHREEKTTAMNIRIVPEKEFVIVHMEKEVYQNMREEVGMIGTMTEEVGMIDMMTEEVGMIGMMTEEVGMIGMMTEEVEMIGTVTEEMVIIGLHDLLTTQEMKDIIITDTTGIEEIGLIGETHWSPINRDTMIDNKREDRESPHKTLNLS